MAPIQKLSNELIYKILSYFEDPNRIVAVDQRAYLSQESFSEPPLPTHENVKTVGNFGATCRRFSEIAATQLFARVTTRFSQHGFERLSRISKSSRLAKNVKKFTYMSPGFYVAGQHNIQALLPQLQQTIDFDLDAFNVKLSSQKTILEDRIDVDVLRNAITSFTNLQHIQILRVQDGMDERLLTYLRQHRESQYLQLEWGPACLRSAKAIGDALLLTNSPFTRLSSPMLSPSSAVILVQQAPGSVSTLADRITCLELHFDDGSDLMDARMLELSGLFRKAFTAAINMEAVHIGFPSHRPISLPLDTLFHGVKWRRLVAFGIQGWKLDTDEIIDFARRHRERLKGLRLRDVMLKEGSMWRDVLLYLRSEMQRLDWVSLRRIGYAHKFDEYRASQGHEVPDDPPGGDSDDEGDDLYGVPDNDSEGDGEEHHQSDDDLPDDDDDTASAASSDDDNNSDTVFGPEDAEMQFPDLNSPTTTNTPWCICNESEVSVEDLGDDGTFVDPEKRKRWEKWVLGRCPEHDPR